MEMSASALAPANSQQARQAPPSSRVEDEALWRAARSFEAVFTAEMLSHAGTSTARSAYGGGFAEETFRSLLSREWASSVVEAGGFGLAEKIYQSLKAARHV